MSEQKTDEKSEIKAKAKTLLKPLQITDIFTFMRSRKRLEVLIIIKDVLPATEKMLIARLHLIMGTMPYAVKLEINSLLTEKLIKKRGDIYNSTSQFDSYLNELWNNIQNYRKEHPEETMLS